MASALVGSEILKIAADIRELVRQGGSVCNLTVGDFSPKQFPIPAGLASGVIAALGAGHTNYPPANGVLELREAVARLYERELGLRYPLDGVLIAGGARPIIYGTYRAVVDPGDVVVYPVPSWNNNHYVGMLGAKGIALPCTAEDRFLPTAKQILEHITTARLICLNSPLNPTGTALDAEVLTDICKAVVAENQRREAAGERALYLMYDHIYWMLCMEGVRHVTPPELVPEMAKYTIFVDGISKCYAATGLRVGWAVGPVDIVGRMNAIIGHVGAWAPRPEQVASVAVLDDVEASQAFQKSFMAGVGERLTRLHDGFGAMKAAGFDVESLPPMGAIYLTVRISPFGKTTPEGVVLKTNEDVRKYLLDHAGFGIVPFQAFGFAGDSGWFRLSVGAVSVDEIDQALPRVREALQALA